MNTSWASIEIHIDVIYTYPMYFIGESFKNAFSATAGTVGYTYFVCGPLWQRSLFVLIVSALPSDPIANGMRWYARGQRTFSRMHGEHLECHLSAPQPSPPPPRRADQVAPTCAWGMSSYLPTSRRAWVALLWLIESVISTANRATVVPSGWQMHLHGC